MSVLSIAVYDFLWMRLLFISSMLLCIEGKYLELPDVGDQLHLKLDNFSFSD